VPQATKLGIGWAKHHTSLFESKALGQRVLARLQQEMMAAGERVVDAPRQAARALKRAVG
jgi:hypothetical protein